ncbi:MAG: CPBP family intramembrane glutamic endopeptidase [Arcticibacter sp.]
MRPGLLSELPLYRKFLVVAFLVMLGTITFSMVASLMISAIWGLNANELLVAEGSTHVNAMKLLVLLGTGIGSFTIPSLAGAFLLFKSPMEELGLRRPQGGASTLIFAVVALVFSLPLINFMVMLNEYMALPDALIGVEQWMKEAEEEMRVITEAMLEVQYPSDLVLNLVVIAAVPAIAEELLFRGLLQNLFGKLTSNKHASIWITAALFSAIHMQFYGFLPRMVLGAAFGYMLVWSGSLWLPIAAHFANNGFAVLVSHLNQSTASPLFDENEVGKGSADIWLVLVSMAVVVFCFYQIKKRSLRSTGEAS